MEDTSEATLCGKFGYEVINSEIIIPYIFRKNEKWCASNIFNWHFEQKKYALTANLIDFDYLIGMEMRREEAYLLREINNWHNDSMYPFDFKRKKDSLVKMDDVRSIFKYTDDIIEKSKAGAQFDMTKGGMVRFRLASSKKNLILPYVEANGKRYVPVHLVYNSNSLPPTLTIQTLTNIDVMYMRYLFDVLKMNLPSEKCGIPCVMLDQLVVHLLQEDSGYYDYDDNFWPSKDSTSSKISNNHPFFNNNNTNKEHNSTEQSKVSSKRKHNDPRSVMKAHTVDVSMIPAKKLRNAESIITASDEAATKTNDTNEPSKLHKKVTLEQKILSKQPTDSELAPKVTSGKHQTTTKSKLTQKDSAIMGLESNVSSKESANTVLKSANDPKDDSTKGSMEYSSEEESDVYEVEQLIDYKMYKGKERVLVRWKGYGPYYDTWEPITNLNDGLEKDVEKLRENWANKSRK